MDTRLRILERQAQTSGSATDWEKYARALRRAIHGEDAGPINAWVVIKQDTHDLFRVSASLHLTEAEAKGEIVREYIDFAKPHIPALSSDEEPSSDWDSLCNKFVGLVETGKFEEAWEFYHGEELDGTLFEGIIDLLPMFGLEQHSL